MDALMLLQELTRQGFILAAEGDAIRVSPPSRLTDPFRQAIIAWKAELLELLRAERPVAAAAGHAGRRSLADADRLDVQGAAALWHGPAGVPIYFQDEAGRPCERSAAFRWTYEGAPSWYCTERYPPEWKFEAAADANA
jgi:hypothetical protein